MKRWSKLKKAVIISAVGIFGLIGLGSAGSSTKQQVNKALPSPTPSAVQGAETTQQPAVEPATTPDETPVSEPAPVAQPVNCPNGTYINSDGISVCSPYSAASAPAGATAKCLDGTYSFSLHHSGTCSHHGGVADWL